MSPTLVPSWNRKRIYGTWITQQGDAMRAGSYKVTIPARVTNAADDVIIPAGVFAQGALNVTTGLPSLDIVVPCTDDPDNSPTGWQVTIEVTFTDASGEKYLLDVPIAGGDINLRTIVLAASIPAPTPMLIRGVPGGIAELDADGDVIDAYGEKVTGADDIDLSGYATTSALELRAPLASPTFTGTVSGITKAMVGLGNVDNTTDANKPISTATATALAAKAPLASPTFTGTVSGISKAMVGLGNVDNTTDANKPISTATQTALDAKASTSAMTSALAAKATLLAVGVTGSGRILIANTSTPAGMQAGDIIVVVP